MNVEIKRLLPGDGPQLAELLEVFRDAFGMKDFSMPPASYLEMVLRRDAFVVYTAQHDGAIIGGLTAYVLRSYYCESSEVYIYDLAVSTGCQRKGVGRHLIEALTAFCRERGYREFFVQADEVDTHALEFYRAAGGVPEQVVHFNFPI